MARCRGESVVAGRRERFAKCSIGQHLPRSPRCEIQAEVHGDPEEPRAQLRPGGKARQRAVHADEDLLRHVAGVLMTVHQAAGDSVDGLAVLDHERRERALFAALKGLDQGQVFRVRTHPLG
jgi:hypothetical protein